MRRALTCLLSLLLAGCHARPAGSPTNAAPPTPTPAGPVRVIVVGGGLAGLISAYELEKRGISTALLEATDVWGGRVATATYAEGTFAEYGMQEMWADNPLLGIARALQVPLDRMEEPYSSVVLGGKLIPYVQPTADAFFASFLDPGERRALKGFMDRAQAMREKVLQAGAGPDLGPELQHLQDISFADWVATFHLPRRVAEWIRLTLECELATDWGSFSGLIGLIEFRFFLGAGQPNYHVRGGNARLIAALADAIPGEKMLSSTVTAIDRWQTPDGRTRARVSYMRDQRVQTLEADRVILTVPFFRVHQILIDPPLSDEKWQAILTLDRGQYTVVHLLVDKDARPIWTVGGQSPFPVLTDGPLGVIYGVTRESPASQPLEVFSLLIHGAAAGAFHMIPREIKVRQIKAALDRLWPGLSAHVHASHVYTYHPAALPVWPPGRSPLDHRGRALREPELGLYLAGDYTVSGHSNGAAESAQAVAARISEELQGRATGTLTAPPAPTPPAPRWPAAPPRSRPAPRPADPGAP